MLHWYVEQVDAAPGTAVAEETGVIGPVRVMGPLIAGSGGTPLLGAGAEDTMTPSFGEAGKGAGDAWFREVWDGRASALASTGDELSSGGGDEMAAASATSSIDMLSKGKIGLKGLLLRIAQSTTG